MFFWQLTAAEKNVSILAVCCGPRVHRTGAYRSSLCVGDVMGQVLLALLTLIQSVYYLSFRMCLFWYQKVSKCIFHCIVLFPQFPRNLLIKWCVMILEVLVLGALQLFYFSITMKLFSAWTCSVSYLFQKDYLLSQGRMNVLRPKWKEMK